MTAPVLFSVLVPTRQRRPLLGAVLLALDGQTLSADRFEVIVAVDGSTDGTTEMLAARVTPYCLRSVRLDGRGRAAAVTAALDEAHGEFVAILDDDMEPCPGFLTAHERALRRAERVGVVGAVPVVIQPGAPLARRYVAARFDRHLRKLAQRPGDVSPADFYSGNFSIRRALLAAVGGFDAAYQVYGNEDRDLAVRLRAAGVRLVFDADAAARQQYVKSAGELIADHFAKGRTAVLFGRKHPGGFADMPFRSYRGGSRSRRAARRLLVGTARTWPGLDPIVVRAGTWLERYDPPGAPRLLRVLLDYAFWRGAAAALRETPDGSLAGGRPDSTGAR